MISISTKIQIILFPYKSTMIRNGIYKTFLGKKTKLKQQLCQILKVCIKLLNVLLLEKNNDFLIFFTVFTAKYKHPENCPINDCNYYVEMKQIDQNVISFNILFKNNEYIQIGLSEHLENVRNIDQKHYLL